MAALIAAASRSALGAWRRENGAATRHRK